MSSPAVEFDHVTKTFRRHHAGPTLLRHQLMAYFRSTSSSRFMALNNISFQVDQGESLAVIGANGAGKSTLLSLVAGLSRPDNGTICVRGRVAALLELGSGFHPDLTGTENIFINAALLGFSRKDAQARFPEIVHFADIGGFLNEPLRTYSTGMVMRLAFAVSVHLDPDILIADEVLAVGDHTFQAKCFAKIHQFRDVGKTLLFVSHAPGMLQQICTRAIWLDSGHLMMDGPLDQVVSAYHETSSRDELPG